MALGRALKFDKPETRNPSPEQTPLILDRFSPSGRSFQPPCLIKDRSIGKNCAKYIRETLRITIITRPHKDMGSSYTTGLSHYFR